MARSTKAQVQQRLRDICPLVADCMTMREIRAWVNAKTEWGAAVSDSTLKYYARRAKAEMKASADFDFTEELGLTKCRLERIIARCGGQGRPAHPAGRQPPAHRAARPGGAQAHRVLGHRLRGRPATS